nr:MAG TPA: hypothetical protein [Caudoviricetes sp.]DAU95416.1 MAG TPA: hypothetical protein [Caudoviricetes sp.]DAZ36528.1 MAG TPA: hypothetical protein [Caudoviricetes sp.]
MPLIMKNSLVMSVITGVLEFMYFALKFALICP